MKKHPVARTSMIVLLTAALSTACIPGALALAQDTTSEKSSAATSESSAASISSATFEKTEVVYATLAANGSPEAVYVVNQFDVEKAGMVIDAGDYTSVQNLTNETALDRKGDSTTFEVDEGTFYYQGNAASTTLPWTIALTYELDGKQVSADELAGASGDLAIRVKTSPNAAVDSAFYDSFMLQITFTLPGDACSDVVAEGATVASSGEDRTVAFTVLPGSDGDFTLTAKVQDFHMAGAQVAALPYSSVIEMPDTAGMTDSMSDLSSAVSQLTDGTASLASGVDELTGGAQSLSSGAAAFGQGLAQLDGSSGTLVNASSQIKSALSQIAAGLGSADFSQIDQLKQLPGALNELAAGLEQFRSGYDQAHGVLGGAIDNLLANAPSETEIAALQKFVESDSAQSATVSKLVGTYRAAQAVKVTYDQLAPAFDTSSAALAQQIAALRTMASSIDVDSLSAQVDGLSSLASGISQLSGEYGQFHDGLAQYTSGLSALSSNYSALESGVNQLANGTGQLASGAGTLANGMGELNAATITLPDTMKEQIAEMMADYDFPEFNPVSFVSNKNENVEAVQFVMTTAAIEKQEPEVEEEPEPELTIWDRFVALFQG